MGTISGIFKLRFIVKLKYLTWGSLRSSPSTAIANINPPSGEVLNVTASGFSSFWDVVLDVMISRLKVYVPMFKNRRRKIPIITIEMTPPLMVRYLA